MKIYTRTGDEGQTSLLGGTRVPKYHLRIESYGTVDELNSWMGIIRAQTTDETLLKTLEHIQETLFTAGSLLATDPAKNKVKIPGLVEEDVTLLENEMDRMDKELPALKNFILPGANTAEAQCHVARCVCRRAERLVTHLAHEEEVSALVVKYLNRLSDYLFMLGRYVAHSAGAKEIPWRPRG